MLRLNEAELVDIIKEEICRYTNINKGIVKEYLDKYFASNLKKYLHMTPEEKKEEYCREKIQSFPSWFLNNFQIDNIDEVVDELQLLADEYDWDNLVNFLRKYCDDATLNKLIDKFYQDTLNNDPFPPTSEMMDYNRDVKNEWLVHFSDNAYLIATEGFKYATDELENLSFTNAGSTNKPSEGFNFAFSADDKSGLREGDMYGNDAVMFRASGIEARHYGDEQDQVMFWNKDAKDIVYLQHDREDDEWFVQSRLNDRILFRGDINTVVDWVARNFAQYRKHLVYNKESRVRKNNFRKSEYNYNRKIY